MKELKLELDILEYLEPLTMAERGQLLTAMLAYAREEAVPGEMGSERYLWPVVRRQIDRARERYLRLCKANAENSARAAAKRAEKKAGAAPAAVSEAPAAPAEQTVLESPAVSEKPVALEEQAAPEIPAAPEVQTVSGDQMTLEERAVPEEQAAALTEPYRNPIPQGAEVAAVLRSLPSLGRSQAPRRGAFPAREERHPCRDSGAVPETAPAEGSAPEEAPAPEVPAGQGDAPEEEAPQEELPPGVAILLPLFGGGNYPIYDWKAAEWAEKYRGVSVEQELRKMRRWLLANPAKRRSTKDLIPFVLRWLTRVQEKGGPKRPSGPPAPPPSFDLAEIRQLMLANSGG